MEIDDSDSESHSSDSSSLEGYVDVRSSSAEASPRVPFQQNENSLQECMETLRNVIGDEPPYEDLMRLALAADNDSSRALNFYFENGFGQG